MLTPSDFRRILRLAAALRSGFTTFVDGDALVWCRDYLGQILPEVLAERQQMIELLLNLQPIRERLESEPDFTAPLLAVQSFLRERGLLQEVEDAPKN